MFVGVKTVLQLFSNELLQKITDEIDKNLVITLLFGYVFPQFKEKILIFPYFQEYFEK